MTHTPKQDEDPIIDRQRIEDPHKPRWVEGEEKAQREFSKRILYRAKGSDYDPYVKN